MGAGVSGFIAKPFTPAAVLKSLAKALTPRPAGTARPTAGPSPAAPVDDDPQAMTYL